ncbi:hypothetical protein OG948_19860 [Embleya sp. NBC_00888]|uniref:hypothetical protein n=1 Tax=Embleya sp. NBC_00888 TaxID=2975960 RepID=UPI00386A243B|nr:hypothetical protein OG948_19860 [Embleya sp. NBC_00888]
MLLLRRLCQWSFSQPLICVCPDSPPIEDEFAVGNYGSHFLGDDTDLAAITRVRYALDKDSDREAGTVRAAEIRFPYGGVLFLDPMYHWGIRLEGTGAYDRWLTWQREDTHIRAAFGPIEDHTWTP